ncbi:hypothetical protein HJB56_30990 [Rhizobium lentis]|uniref:Uncharacterized protein n=1 Tax=Rhizobium binae TaxID=1138190 RepID=A0ABV2MR64_9HYPH|nr:MULTISPECIES: hypothetical protein [Rhizobium]NKL50649.1 hypothetical protein [Rhizobium leguminosarum bv. viciae]MBX4925800.1 hypothetical protein [Rhizobium binae]MBX4996089.1 hypothetical protein [Rhizobium binae]MBX5020499.1 hypothetical protein [Rhizobium lentis]MBX5087153.1 hypothetical protein [Rhizobium lentis]
MIDAKRGQLASWRHIINMGQVGFALLRAQARAAEEPETEIPVILWDGVLYDPDLDRFFRDFPLNGVRSRHSFAPIATTFVTGMGAIGLSWTTLPGCSRIRWVVDDVDPENPKGDWPITGLVVIPDIGKIIFKRQKQLRRLSV